MKLLETIKNDIRSERAKEAQDRLERGFMGKALQPGDFELVQEPDDASPAIYEYSVESFLGKVRVAVFLDQVTRDGRVEVSTPFDTFLEYDFDVPGEGLSDSDWNDIIESTSQELPNALRSLSDPDEERKFFDAELEDLRDRVCTGFDVEIGVSRSGSTYIRVEEEYGEQQWVVRVSDHQQPLSGIINHGRVDASAEVIDFAPKNVVSALDFVEQWLQDKGFIE